MLLLCLVPVRAMLKMVGRGGEFNLQPLPNYIGKESFWKIKLQKWHRGNVEVEDLWKKDVERNTACYLIEMLNQEVERFGLSLN